MVDPRMLRSPQAVALRAAWAPSRLRRVVRHRLVRAVVVVGVGVLCSVWLVGQGEQLQQARDAWTEYEPVVVITADVGIGEVLRDSVEIVERPAALVPAGALSSVDADAVARVQLYPGEILLGDRIGGASVPGLSTGHAAITLSIANAVPFASAGDLVDLWIVDSANLTSRAIARSASVLAVDDRDITVAVPEADVARVTVASLRPVTVTLIG